MTDERMLRRQDGDEVDRHDCRTLVQHLEESMLAVRTRFAPRYGGGWIDETQVLSPRSVRLALSGHGICSVVTGE